MRRLLTTLLVLVTLFGWAAPASASFSIIGSAQAGSTDDTSATTAGITTTGANLIIISLSWYNGGTGGVLAPTDSNGNTWVGLTQQQQSTHVANRLFYCYGPTVGAGHTFSASSASSFPSIQVLAVSGAVVAPFDDQNGAVSNSAATLATGGLLPNVNNSLLVAGISHEANASATPTIDGGFTVAVTSTQTSHCEGGGIAYLIQTTATAANPTWNVTNATKLAVTLAVFKPAGGGTVAPRGMLLGVGP